MNDLTARVLNAIPAGAYEMNALLSLLRIEETDAVPTASVSCERRPVLRINPDFVRRHCRTDEHLFLLVMHELHHVLLGHTRLFPRADARPQPGVRRADQRDARPALPRRGLPVVLSRSLWRGGRTAAAARASGGPRDRGRRAAPPPSPALRGRAARRRRRSSTRSPTRWRVTGQAARGSATVLLGSHADDERRRVGNRRDRSTDRSSRRSADIVEKWPPPETPDPRPEPGGRAVARRRQTGSTRPRACSRRCGARCSARPRSGRRAPRRRGGTSRSRTPCRARPTGARRSCAAPARSRCCTGGRRRSRRGRDGPRARLPRRQRQHGRRTCRSSTARSSRSARLRRTRRAPLLDGRDADFTGAICNAGASTRPAAPTSAA